MSDGATVCSESEAELYAEVGIGPSGGLLRLQFETDRVASGPSAAPKVVAALETLGEMWDLALPEVEAAPEVIGPRAGV